MASAEQTAENAERTSIAPVNDKAGSFPDIPPYAGPEWMGKANWHSVAETYLLKFGSKPGLFLMTKLMLAINRRNPQALLNRSYDGQDRLLSWVKGVKGTRTEDVRLPNCAAQWTWNVNSAPGPDGPVVIYFHGSAFITLGINSHRPLVSRIARDAGARALSVGYRLCPQYHVEDAIEDGIDAYRYVLDQGVAPENIVFAGDSAGGYLTTMTAVTARDRGMPVPAGCVLMSAATDTDMETKMAQVRRAGDAMFPAIFLNMINDVFLRRNGARETGPYPVAAELSGLGPFLLQVGSQEALRPDSELLAQRLADSGVPVRLQIFDRSVHMFQFFAGTNPDAKRAVDQIAAFIKARTA